VLILPLHRPLAVSRKGVHVDYVWQYSSDCQHLDYLCNQINVLIVVLSFMMVRGGNKFYDIFECSLLGLCYETDLISGNYDILRTF
jgi:hypothetical protein